MVLLLFALFIIGAIAEQLDKSYVPATTNNVNYRNQPFNYPYGYTPNYPYRYSNSPYNYPSSNYPYYSSANPFRNYPYNSNYPYNPNYPHNPDYPNNPNYPYASTPYQRGYPYNNNYPSLNNYYNKAAPSYYNQARILRYNNNNDGTGNYQFDYETENGIRQQEVGQLKQIDSPDPATVVQGSYSYVAPNGETYTVDYVADENGFQPSGNHIPLQKSYLSNPNAAYRRYYNYPEYVTPANKDGNKY